MTVPLGVLSRPRPIGACAVVPKGTVSALIATLRAVPAADRGAAGAAGNMFCFFNCQNTWGRHEKGFKSQKEAV